MGVVLGLTICAGEGWASPRADIVVYADHQPPPITSNPFLAQEDSDDPITKILLERVPGLYNPLGAGSWEVEAWGKYVFLSNYDEAGIGLFQNIIDQRIGVFDTEKKTFCQLDLDPSTNVNAGVEWLAVATPQSRQSRIYFQGFDGAAFGWIEGDLDNPSPCDATTGWSVIRFSPADLNAAGADLGSAKTPCPGGFCYFDGMRLLSHDDVANRDTLAFHNWGAGRNVVVTVDAAGTLAVAAVYVLPPWIPSETDGACMTLRPVADPAVDPTRGLSDQRFLSSFDVTCDVPDGTPGCAPYIGFCPGTGMSCTLGVDTCPTSTCDTTQEDCTTDADCSDLFTVGHCTNACKPIHPGQYCSVTRTHHCARDVDCPSGETCVCGDGHPLQEFSFDGVASLVPTSAIFQATAPGGSDPLTYDTYGDAWLSSGPNLVWGSTPTGVAMYARGANTVEHGYFTTSDPAGSEVQAPTTTFPFETSSPVFGTPAAAFQFGNAVYTAGSGSVQREVTAYGAWAHDTAFKVSLGANVLPAEPKRCTGGPNNGEHCLSATDCPGGRCVVTSEAAGGQAWPADIAFGGSPPSMWLTPRFGGVPRAGLTAYLIRIPRAAAVPDSVSAVRPGVTWSSNATCVDSFCDRLWMVAEHSGVLKFRVRDDGLWSTWYALPTNLATTGGASVVFFNGAVEIYGRSSTGTVITSHLTSPINCQPASCTWANWSVLPASPTTDQEPAVDVQGTTGVFVAIRRASDGRVVYARRQGPLWSPWTNAGNSVLPKTAPALAWNPLDGSTGKMWLFAVDPRTGGVAYGTISGLTFGRWSPLPLSGVEPWGTAPQAIWDGTRVRVFIGNASFPNLTYQITNANSGWDNWAPTFSEGQSTRQPVAALVNGDVHLITYTAGTAEQLVK
jgi:hypothetical protein